MKHIAKVIIDNFQSHSHTELHFGPGFNVIVGPSDNGKSAVLRAIRWALYNEPRGSDFVRAGTRECRVTVTMSDGAEITRELLLTKSGASSRNRYTVTFPGEEPQVFEGFGVTVPAEVIRAHGMPPVALDTDKRVGLSFGAQLDGPFLMSETGSTRARAIGRLLGVHVVDAAIRSTQRDLKSSRGEVTRLEGEVARYDQELDQYADIQEQEEQIAQAEALLMQAEESSQRVARLEKLQTELARAQVETDIVTGALARLQGVEQAQASILKAEGIQLRSARLERLNSELRRVSQESTRYRARVDALQALPLVEKQAKSAAERQDRLSGLTGIQKELRQRDRAAKQTQRAAARLEGLSRADDALVVAAAKMERLRRLQEKRLEWVDVQRRLAKGMEMQGQNQRQLQHHLTEYENLLRRLGRCPTCMQPVEPSSIKNIVSELAGGPDTRHTHQGGQPDGR